MAGIIVIVIRRSLTFESDHRNQPNKSKLALNKPLLHFSSKLKQLYISTKMELFFHKGGCGIRGCTHIETFKRRAGLSYR